MADIDPLIVRELTNASWFFLSMILFALFAGLWLRSIGSGIQGQAAGALVLYFLASMLARGWNWIGLELVRRGGDADALLLEASWPAIAFNLLGVLGAVLIVRAFFPSLFFGR